MKGQSPSGPTIYHAHSFIRRGGRFGAATGKQPPASLIFVCAAFIFLALLPFLPVLPTITLLGCRCRGLCAVSAGGLTLTLGFRDGLNAGRAHNWVSHAGGPADALTTLGLHPPVNTNSCAPTLLTPVPPSAMFTHACTPTFLAFAALTAMRANAAATAILALAALTAMLANATATALLALAALATVLANAPTPTFLTLAALFAVLTWGFHSFRLLTQPFFRGFGRPGRKTLAVSALRLDPVVLADPRAAAILATIPAAPVLTNSTPPTLFADALLPTVRTNTCAFTLFTLAALTTVLTNSAATTFLAMGALSHVHADAAPSTLLTLFLFPPMHTHT
mmetsp:Transcript_14/g.53  ORF Transcript_14/g.53 Transcript_14/m.53 type:complete len:337 (+) Transcript_14:186-1196(+)